MVGTIPEIIHVPANAPIKSKINKAGRADFMLAIIPSCMFSHEKP
jgi:hypothetical protein